MKKSLRIRAATAGMTIIEVLAVVAVAGVVFSFAYTSVEGIKDRITEEKLVQDVDTINRAIRLHELNGGDMALLDWVAYPSWIFGQLKVKMSDADTHAGLSGRLIDSRLQAELMTSAEMDSETPRAVWDDTKNQYVIVTGSTSNEWQIARFKLSDGEPDWVEQLVGNYYADSRSKRAYNYASDSTWVWDYDADSIGGSRAGPTEIALSNPFGGGSATASGLPAGVSRLSSPTFSIPPGSHPLVGFPMALQLGNPNDPAVSEIWYSTSLGNWHLYDGTPIPVYVSNTVIAYAKSTDTSSWADSYFVDSAYEAIPVTLDLAATGPASVNWMEVGGPVEPGGPGVPLAGDGLISLANAGAIPDGYESSSNFLVYWTVDGSDPASSPTRTAGGAFSGGFGGESVSVLLAEWGTQSNLPIQAIAKSLDKDLFVDSAVETQTVNISATSLRAPAVEINAGQATITLDPSYGDLPTGARVYYTTDGTDPGESSGEPATGTLYEGPFTVDLSGPPPPGECTNEVAVTARVYGPSGQTQWFDVSAAASEVAVGGAPEPGTFAALVCLSGSLCDYAWLLTGGSGVLNGAPTHVDGDVAVGAGASFNPGAGSVNGSIIPHGDGTGGTEDLTQPIADAMALAIGLEDLAPTQTFGTISNNTTISATAADGVNVINLGGINLTGHKKLTLSGSSDDWFILNVGNTFKLSGHGAILTSGGVDPSKVIFNVSPGVSEVKVTGGGTVFPGTILAPGTNLHIAGGSTVYGSIISGGSSQMLAGGSAILGTHHFGGCN